ncbi:Edem2 [Symbiodinium natans]|uniref:alpha-1,2-Mannosidase n=1 Tax=Symbiodinium natans TaxID=878477 RepID=A0A812IQ46_9DINO|nr:Edem2 [Symbiodinium natans]
MYKHAFDSYMSHAFPADELRPLSCDGRLRRERGDLDAMLGNYSMTLIDSLDSLVIFKRKTAFKVAVSYIDDNVHFGKDLEVSTFEVNIRILGGLLSGHLHAQKILPKYTGGLLDKALDLGERLMRAFDTPTGMPRSRVNLAKGIPKGSSATVTIAEAGSFLLEFGMLSHLSGQDRFYKAAKRSLLAFWGRRNILDLVGTSIDVNTGNFVDQQSTTGPGQDSFFEYLLKGYILFHDLELLEIFLSAYASVELYHSFEGFTYNVDMNKGLMANTHLSPLACVWASLQVLVGDVSSGLRSVLYWYGLWKKHDALPEVFDTRAESPTQARDSPLRPELIEAIFYLSLALPGDSMIFDMAKNIAAAIDDQSRVNCGFASVADVTTKRLDDRMDSFFLSETLVYLYLALAPPEDLAHAMPWPVGASIFTTEGHLFPIFPKASDSTHLSATTDERNKDLYPAASLDSPLLTCEALTPFERVAVQQRCRTKYLLTPSYQMQMNAETSRRCRSQTVFLLVWSAGDTLQPVMHVSGLASSLGRPVPVLPLLHAQLQDCSHKEG